MELYAIRHGETTANEEDISASRLEGHYDNLNKEGIRQAQGLILKLKPYKFDMIIVSPMKRTIQTLQPYLDSLDIKPEVIILDLVNERELGDFAGKTNGEVSKIKKSSGDSLVEWAPLNGESQIQVNKRVKEFVEFLKRDLKSNSKILLCSHFNFLTLLDIFLSGKNIKEFPEHLKPKNGELKKYNL